jgi:Rad3-related DNA helicase
MPYNLLLPMASRSCLEIIQRRPTTFQETREALGIRLEGAVLVIDEAHNLVDAVNSAHSATLSVQAASAAAGQLDAYWSCFSTRLAPGVHVAGLHLCYHVGES